MGSVSEQMPDVVVEGAAGTEPVRFDWKLDNETLKDINRAIGLDAGTHGRGFLGRLMHLWLLRAPEGRPLFEVPRMRHDDLIFVPSPCYIIAMSDDHRRLSCWYSVLVDAQPAELLDHKRGVWVFEVAGLPDILDAYLDCIVKTFKLRVRAAAEGYTFYRMI